MTWSRKKMSKKKDEQRWEKVNKWEVLQGVCKVLLFFVLFAGFVLGLNRWLYFKDGSICSSDERVRTYQTLPKDSVDVLLVGSSHFMCGINPVILWEEEGISAYNLSTRAQTLPFTYLNLKEAFKTQSPEYVILDAYFVIDEKEQYGLINNEDHLNMNMSVLPFSLEKAKLIHNHIPFRERLHYYAPFVLYHSRWKRALEVQPDNPDIFLGFACGEDEAEEPVTFEEPEPLLHDQTMELDAIDYEYLDKIIRLCEENDAKIIVVKTPANLSKESIYRLERLDEVLSEKGIPYVNYLELYKETDFSYAADFRDATHLNSQGADKITRHFMNFLVDYKETETGAGFKDHRGDETYSFWEKESLAYHAHQRERGRE